MTQKCFKFTFFAFLDILKLNLKFPCTISIIWKRGQKLSQVKQRKQIVNGIATFKEQLSIECNMIYDQGKKLFESKKTIFSILIFTDKGTKQAGQIQIDVAELLNNKQEQKAYETNLLKCPDKNAKLVFNIKPSFKQEIKMDAISQKSTKNVDVEKVAGTINISEANFKKKRKAPQENIQMPIVQTKNVKTQNHISFNEQDVKILTDENKKYKQSIKQSKKEIDKIKKSIQNSQKIITQQKKKCEGFELQITRLKKVSDDFSDTQQQNRILQNEVLICKLKLAEIFNKAFQIGGPGLVDRLQQACGYIENLD